MNLPPELLDEVVERTSFVSAAAPVSHDAARARLVGVRELAEYLGTSAGFVYEHADELGARRLGKGPRARLRFSLAEVDERLSACSASRESVSPEVAPQAVSRPRRRQRSGTNVELLPIRGRIPAVGGRS